MRNSHVLEHSTHDDLPSTLEDEPHPALHEPLLASEKGGVVSLEVGRPDGGKEGAVQLRELREER